MSEILDIRVIPSQEFSTLKDMIKLYIKDGWEPWGKISHHKRIGNYFVAMVKYKKEIDGDFISIANIIHTKDQNSLSGDRVS